MRMTLLLVPVSTILFFGCSGAPSLPPFKPVVDVKELMNSVVDPSADVLWNSTATIQTMTGTEERRPRTAEEWTAVKDSATMVAGAGNLLM